MSALHSNRWVRAAALAAVVGVVLSGCSKSEILDADTPDVITPDNLTTPEGQAALFAGAVSDMVVSASSAGGGVIIWSGLFTDEFKHASTPPAVREWDLRALLSTNSVAVGQPNPATGAPGGPFIATQRARAALEYAASVLPSGDARAGEALALAGMAYIHLGEMWCSGVPISNRETGETGPPLSTAQLFDTAIERLNSAAASTGGDARINNLIAVLRGRTLLDQGQFAQAASAVANVPTSYQYEFIHGNPPARQTNQVWLQNASDIYSVSDKEGTNGLDFGSANDPRVPVSAPALSRNDAVTQHQYFLKYSGQDDPIVMASGIEARLIEAEAALQGSDVTGWLNKLNEARSSSVAPAGLAPLTDPGTQTARENLMFRERAFWMYLTGHRLGDLRRLIKQYGRARESVFPTGAYHKQGLTYGQDRAAPQAAFIVPQPEENNSNFDPSVCDPAAP